MLNYVFLLGSMVFDDDDDEVRWGLVGRSGVGWVGICSRLGASCFRSEAVGCIGLQLYTSEWSKMMSLRARVASRTWA